jgi:hypothetical protein
VRGDGERNENEQDPPQSAFRESRVQLSLILSNTVRHVSVSPKGFRHTWL